MGASIVSKSDKELVIQINVTLESSMLKTEESIQQSLNQAGCQATKMALSNYDSNGDPIMVHDLKYTSKGLIEKKYQTPYGEIKLHNAASMAALPVPETGIVSSFFVLKTIRSIS